MGRKRAVVPQLREFQGYATCWVNGKREYFGRWGTEEAEEKFRSFVAQLAANPAATPKDAGGILAHLIGGYLKSPDAPAAEDKRRAMAFLINHLGPLALKEVNHVTAQEVKAMFKRKAEETRSVKDREGEVEPRYSQTTLRSWFANLKRVYAWAVECKKVSGDAAAPVLAIRKLPIQAARREKDVEPVPRSHVEATLKFLTPTVAAMVRLQLLTGMRPSDIFNMTGAEVHRGGLVKIGGIARDLDREGVWVYVRKVHKTARFGHARVIVLGDEERAIVGPRLTRPEAEPLFKPFESFTESYRKGVLDLKRAKPGARPFNAKWTRQGYAKAVERAAAKAGVPHWSPYQIRHLVSAETQAEHDLDTARAKLGQKSINVAARYADLDFKKAANAARRKGKGGPASNDGDAA